MKISRLILITAALIFAACSGGNSGIYNYPDDEGNQGQEPREEGDHEGDAVDLLQNLFNLLSHDYILLSGSSRPAGASPSSR